MTVIRVPNAKETPPAAVREVKAIRELSAKEMAQVVGGHLYNMPKFQPYPLSYH